MGKYYLGIDGGTDSIGWAVTDEEYKILKNHGKAMWGIRLMDGGETAQERRKFRSNRRRTDRDKFRQACLEMLFNEEISKIDIAFFQRLKDSALYDGDKKVEGKYSIFNDADYNDMSYHKDYPTIYHLRKELIESQERHDVRLVYLAISHIIKNRGHFLFDSDELGNNDNSDFQTIWQELAQYSEDNEYCDKESNRLLNCNNFSDIEEILKNRALTSTKKKDLLTKELSLNKKEDLFEIAVITLLSGGTVKAKDIFSSEEYEDTEAKSITFKSKYDEKASVYENTFLEKFELIEKIKAIYDWTILADILNGKDYVSYAKVDTYEKHKRDLKLLKNYVKDYVPQKYDLIFNENSKDVSNYLAYSGYSKKSSVVKKCSQEDFCEFLKKQLPEEPSDEKYQNMYNEIASHSFMPKAVTKDNAVIPMQLNRQELKKILANAEKYLPFLSEKDDTGKTVSTKIMDIFDFKIPYYVGPLNSHSDKAWVARTNEKIYPWNFEQVVDVDKSAENFIEKLTSKCTYLPCEDVIPKCSLLYSAYMVLNELNNLKIDGEPLSVPKKQEIYEKLFLKRNKVTVSGLKKYLLSAGDGKDIQITGINEDFKANLKSFQDLQFIDLPDSQKEEIIKAITIFGDDKKLLKKRLKNQYSSLSDDDIATIAKLKYTGWGRFSKEFLTNIKAMIPNGTGEDTSIIRALWETNDNLIQLLSDRYKFREKIEEENKNIESISLEQEVMDLYVSPKIKRPILQTMQIVEEIVKIQGEAPAKIFIEVARGDEEKKRTVTRKKRLLDLYEKCQKEEGELYEQLKNTSDKEFKRDALYLYYTQFGRCMYTNQPIDISEIYNKNLYDIDHIYPRSKIKDDSLDNRVLVTKESNQKKGNNYPIDETVRGNINIQSHWKLLRSKGLISEEKFNRLTRKDELTDEDISAFLARQIVETRQSTKAIYQLLQKYYPETKIECIKAGLVSDFRKGNMNDENVPDDKKYEFIKCRDVNDFHHAKDAYLNIVVGNVYTTKARQDYFIKNIQSGKWSLNKMFDYSTEGAWEVENNKSLNIVKSTMAKNNILFTRYAFMRKGSY
jgi:CRISPR-associated endonuclease Csn1